MITIALLAACSDYDLQNGDKPPEDTFVPDSPPPDSPPPEEPDIHVFPDTLEFGYVMKNCPAEPLTLTIQNVGTADLEVSEITLSGEGTTKFTLAAAPITLAFGESTEATVDFTPTAYATYEVSVDITSNDPDEGLLGVPTSGTGAEEGYYEETFIQEYDDKIDVLWVVDNSGSMSESVGKVATSFDDFMDVFLTLGLDYHLGVVTTDMDNPAQSGKLQGSPVYIDATHTDPKGWFTATANQGFSGSGDERGFEAAQAALTDPLASGANAGFLRTDTSVAVIVISDENDSSFTSAASFTGWFETLRADTDQTTFNAIVGDDFLGCFGSGIEASGGDKYIDAADSTDGVFVSICSADYKAALTNLSQSSAGMDLSFELAKTPSDISRIEVTVDGVVIDTDLSDGWTYDSAGNSIDFHGASVPEPDAVIYIRYPVDGACN